MIRDIRYLLRSIRRSPGFAAAVILTLALGIGSTTAIVSVVDYVLLRHLPFDDASRLVMMMETDARGGRRVPSNPTAVDWLGDVAAREAFEGITYVRGDGVQICAGDRCESKGSAFVKPDFFPLLRPKVAAGRLLLPDDQYASTPVVVISHRLWRSQLGSDPRAVGRRILIDSVPKVIVGVLAPGAVYPPFADVWQPITTYGAPEILQRRGFHADSRTLGRLRPGIDSTRAATLMSGIGKRLGMQYPDEQKGWTPSSVTLHQELVGNVRPMLLTFASAAALILILVCANVAALLITRGLGRRRELVIRIAMGASPLRIARQLVLESAGYGIIGAIVGSGLAALTLRLARRGLASQLPAISELTLDSRLLVIALIATGICVAVCGVFPALWARRRAISDVLAAFGSATTTSPAASRARQLLVTLQFALALVLLIGAGLLTRSFIRAANVDVGFDPQGVYTMRIVPPGSPDAAGAAALYARVMDAMRTVPGVRGAAFINHAPFGTASITTTLVVDGRLAADSSSQLFYRTVSSSYRDVMRVTMAAGRWFDRADEQAGAPVFVINETTAKRYWPGASPIGARVRVALASQARSDFGTFVSGTIIGVVRDVHQVSQDVLPLPEVYVPYTLEPWAWGMLVVRADASALTAMPEALRQVDSRLVSDANPAPFSHLRDAVSTRLEPRVLAIRFIGAFAITGLVLACLGLYGVIAYNVGQRTREIAVRKAIGATDGQVMRYVVSNSIGMVAAGTAVGSVAAWISTRWITSLLFETSVLDPVVYVSAAIALGAVALVATFLPARRASVLDPAVALRQD